MTDPAIQDLLPHNHCYGCGADNPFGLRLKSYRDGRGQTVAVFEPQPHHCAGPRHFVNGGILATIVDCHCVCTAVAAAYQAAGREIGAGPPQHFATASMQLDYRRPTPIGAMLELTAWPVSADDRSYVVSCRVAARGKTTVEARVEAVRVPPEWARGDRGGNGL